MDPVGLALVETVELAAAVVVVPVVVIQVPLLVTVELVSIRALQVACTLEVLEERTPVVAVVPVLTTPMRVTVVVLELSS